MWEPNFVKIQMFQIWFWIIIPGCATPSLAKLWSLWYVSPPNYVPSDTCPWHVGWHQLQNSTDSCFSIPEEVLVEESWRQADSLMNFRICFIPFSTQPRCLCLNAWLWVTVDQCFFFFMCTKRKVINLSVKEFHSYLKQRSFHIPKYFKTFLCCQGRSKNQDPYLVP